jgi:predicted phosphohydrolase
MAIWAIADLHLSFGVPDKAMDVFGPRWSNHAQQIETHWKAVIHPEDLVLIAGDISWAMKPQDAIPDLQWIDKLPGTKVIIRGNHDYWWGSLSKVKSILPPSIHAIQNDAFNWQDVSIAGARLWDTAEYRMGDITEYVENPRARKMDESQESPEEAERIYDRELGRLELSLKSLKKDAPLKIVMTHYPPLGNPMQSSRVSELLKKYGVSICVFGHLHNIREGLELFGVFDQVQYVLTSCDYLHYKPIKIR